MKRGSPQSRMRLGKIGSSSSRGGRRASIAHGDYSARVLVHRRVACAGSEFSRFNLFPYRQVEARRVRRRVLVELVLAAAVGGGAAFANERIDRHRAVAMVSRQAREVDVLRERLVQLKPRTARADQLDALRERDGRRRARIGELNVRRRRIAELLESVGRVAPDYPGVALRAMEIDAGQLLLDGAAADVRAFVRWLAALRKQGALPAPIVDVLERDGAHLRFSVRADTGGDVGEVRDVGDVGDVGDAGNVGQVAEVAEVGDVGEAAEVGDVPAAGPSEQDAPRRPRASSAGRERGVSAQEHDGKHVAMTGARKT
jgi:Tfp pilus assembly protein PilN